MQGITIADSAGRPLLSTHHLSPLEASLALQAALSTSNPITSFNSLSSTPSSSDSDSESDAGEKDGWREKGARGRTGKGALVVCQIERSGLKYLAPVDGNVDPLVPLTYLVQLHAALESYLAGPVTEGSLKDNFDTALLLLSASLSASSGLPLLTAPTTLRDLVPPPHTGNLSRVVSAAGLGPESTASPALGLLNSPLPWRRQGIRHSSNEIYFDHTETLSLLVSPSGALLSTSISGLITARSKLSSMPDLTLSFSDPSLLPPSTYLSLHPCVRLPRLARDKVISFVPPEGSFTLLSYDLPSPPQPPLGIKPTFTTGPSGGFFEIVLIPRTIGVANVEVRLDCGGAVTVGVCSRGGWEVEERTLVWKVGEVGVGRGVISGTVATASPTTPPFPAAFTVTFDSPAAVFSALRVQGVKLVGDAYQVYKGVRTRGRGTVEVRI